MACSNKGCKVRANINPRSGLCPTCEVFFRNVSKRLETQDRQQSARGVSLDAQRNLGNDTPEAVAGTSKIVPPKPNLVNFPTPNIDQALPEVDLNDIIKSCEEAKKGNQVDAGKVMGDMLGMMVHLFSKQTENDDDAIYWRRQLFA